MEFLLVLSALMSALTGAFGPRAVELVPAVEDRTKQVARLPPEPTHPVLERGGDVHTFGKQFY